MMSIATMSIDHNSNKRFALFTWSSFSNRTEHTGDFKKYGISHRKPQSKSKATGKDSRDQRYMMALNSSIKTVCIEIC